MDHTVRAVCVATLALLLVAAIPTNAGATVRTTKVLPPPGHSTGEFTRGEAVDLLDEALDQLKPDSRPLSADDPVGTRPQTEVSMTLRDLYRARSALTGAMRRAADTLLSRGRVFVDRNEDPVTVATPVRRCSTNFCVHYRDGGPEGASQAQVQQTLTTLEQVRAHETGRLGYRTPVSDAPTTPADDNPDGRFDVFLGDLARQGLYGYCAPDGEVPVSSERHAAAFCVLDNDYARWQYGTAPSNALRATAAHEFFHAVQFAYDINEDLWFMEGTAVWVEDEVFDAINDHYQYLDFSALRQPHTPLDYSRRLSPYGSFLFFTYAAERLGPAVVRQFWEHADGARHRYSLEAIRAVMATRGVIWPTFFAVFGSWNTLPNRSYSERGAYPSPALTAHRTLTKRSRSTGWLRVNLPHLTNAPIRVAPHARLKPRAKLLVEVDAPDTARGSTALIQRRFRNGAVSHTMMPLNRYGNGRAQIGFNRRALSSVIVLVGNTSTAMRDCGRIGDSNGSPLYSCHGRGTFDQGQRFAVRATAR